jgi:hypothetical protein
MQPGGCFGRLPLLDAMPSSLGLLHDELTHIFGDIDWLIGEHTLFNFYCCGLPRSKFEAQKKNLIHKLKGPVRLCRHPLLFESCEQTNKHCPECEKEQLKEYGASFITLRSCFPFVNVCSVHGEVLKSMKKQLLLFDDYCQAPPNKYQIGKTMELARKIEECINNSLEHMDTHMDDIIRLLKDRGYIQENNRCQVALLRTHIAAHFEGAFSDKRLALLCSSPDLLDNAIRTLLRENRAVPPMYCVLFKMFLENAVSVHKPVKQSQQEASPEQAKKQWNTVYMTKKEMEELLDAHGSIAAVSKEVGINQTKLASACKLLRIRHVWRPKKVDEKTVEQIESAFRKGSTEAEISQMVGLALTTVYRVLETIPGIVGLRQSRREAGHEQDRVLYLKLREENPELTRNQLKERYKSLWQRLYRRDKEWLATNAPTPVTKTYHAHNPPPAELVEKFDFAVKAVAERCFNQDTHPINGSNYQLRKMSGVSEHAFNSVKAAKLLKLQRFTRDETNRKRMKLAAERSPTAMADSTLAKEAKLRTTTVARLRGKNR